jgi:hypothetical protein
MAMLRELDPKRGSRWSAQLVVYASLSAGMATHAAPPIRAATHSAILFRLVARLRIEDLVTLLRLSGCSEVVSGQIADGELGPVEILVESERIVAAKKGSAKPLYVGSIPTRASNYQAL